MTYETDEEQLEAIKKWWAENGKAVIAGVVLGLGAIFGWRGWVSYEQGRSEAASALYEEVIIAIEAPDPETAVAVGDRLMNDYADTPYAAMAALARAKTNVESGDLQSAAQALRWAMDNGRDVDVAEVARLRLARVQYALNQPDEALATLQQEFPPAYAALVEELRGDILVEKGDAEGARAAYRKALQDSRAVVDRSALEMKLNDLGVVQESGATS